MTPGPPDLARLVQDVLDHGLAGGVQLVMAGGHCHSPSCLSLELWNEDTGESLCKITPRRGQGDEVYDEKGYLFLPPCQWSETDPQLPRPPLLRLDANLSTVKRTNTTHYHYGVMGIWQMRGAYLPPDTMRAA